VVNVVLLSLLPNRDRGGPRGTPPPTPPFYYPQVQAILAPGLLLEYLDVRFDELLDELS
jgi:hypothetical protein